MLDKDIIKKIKYIEVVTRKAVESFLQGAYKSSFKGQGLQFSDIRDYQAGDDVRHIAWKLSAKTPETTYLKVFEEERSLNVSLVVDVSASNLFGLDKTRKVDLIAELTSLLAFSALKTNDFVSLVTFSDDVLTYIPHKKGKKHVMRIISEIFKKELARNKTDIKQSLFNTANLLKKRGIVFIISDFINDIDYAKELRLLNHRHDLVALWIDDKSELEFPKLGLMDIVDPETGQNTTVDTSSLEFRSKQKELFKAHYEKTKKILNSAKVDFVRISTNDDYIKVIEKFFKQRGKHNAAL